MASVYIVCAHAAVHTDQDKMQAAKIYVFDFTSTSFGHNSRFAHFENVSSSRLRDLRSKTTFFHFLFHSLIAVSPFAFLFVPMVTGVLVLIIKCAFIAGPN